MSPRLQWVLVIGLTVACVLIIVVPVSVYRSLSRDASPLTNELVLSSTDVAELGSQVLIHEWRVQTLESKLKELSARVETLEGNVISVRVPDDSVRVSHPARRRRARR